MSSPDKTIILENIFDILETLEKRRAMFLGNGYNFQSLESFISGYSLAANKTQFQKNDYPNFGYFNVWLLGHLKKHFGLAGGWYWQIHNRNLNDDESAFKEFFHFLNVFKNSQLTSEILPLMILL